MFGEPSYGFLHAVRCEADFVSWTWGTRPVASILITTGTSTHHKDVPSHYVSAVRGHGPIYPDLPLAESWIRNCSVFQYSHSILWSMVELGLNFSDADPRKWEVEEVWTSSPDGPLRVVFKNISE
jgi:hypothetical protein